VQRSLAQYEHEQGHEGQVDEVHRLTQTNREEEDRHEATLRLGLTSNTLEGRATGQAVADRRADGAAAEGDAAADERTGSLQRCVTDERYCHVFLLGFSSDVPTNDWVG
jgi:hypothetical protein